MKLKTLSNILIVVMVLGLYTLFTESLDPFDKNVVVGFVIASGLGSLIIQLVLWKRTKK